MFQQSFFNTLRPRQNGRHFADNVFKCIFLTENVWITIKITLQFVPWGTVDDIPALDQIMAWRRPGDQLLSEPMMVRLPTHICVTWPQWVKQTMAQSSLRYEVVPHGGKLNMVYKGHRNKVRQFVSFLCNFSGLCKCVSLQLMQNSSNTVKWLVFRKCICRMVHFKMKL